MNSQPSSTPARFDLPKPHVVIVGGGIAGLTAAYRCSAYASGVDITLIEKEQIVGGKLITERVDSFVIEAGPDSFLSRKPKGIELCRELGLDTRLQGRDERHTATFIKRRGNLYPLPEGFTGMIPTNMEALEASPLLSAEGRARFEAEPTIPLKQDNEEESVAVFMTRRLGAEVFNALIEPLMGGIYAGNAHLLSIEATFPNLPALELKYGSVLKGLEATQRPHAELPPFVSFPTGTAELIEALVEKIGESVQFRMGQGVAHLTPKEEGYAVALESGETIYADGVILATPAFTTARLVEDFDPDLAAAHCDIPYASTAIVTLAYPAAAIAHLEGRGYVVPLVEESDILAATWSSNKWEGRAPDGYALLRLFMGRYGREDILARSDEALLKMARAELLDTVGVAATPLFHRIYRWSRAMPQYTLGHLNRLQTIKACLHYHPTLAVAGAAYRGVGIPDCIASGEAATQRVLRTLFTRTVSIS